MHRTNRRSIIIFSMFRLVQDRIHINSIQKWKRKLLCFVWNCLGSLVTFCNFFLSWKLNERWKFSSNCLGRFESTYHKNLNFESVFNIRCSNKINLHCSLQFIARYLLSRFTSTDRFVSEHSITRNTKFNVFTVILTF